MRKLKHRLKKNRVLPDFIIEDLVVPTERLPKEAYGSDGKVLLPVAMRKRTGKWTKVNGKKRAETVPSAYLVPALRLVPPVDELLNYCVQKGDIVGSAMKIRAWAGSKVVQGVTVDPTGHVVKRHLSKNEITYLVKKAASSGWTLVTVPPKWLHGGGQGAEGTARLFFAKKDFTPDLFRRDLKVDISKLVVNKAVARTQLLFADRGPKWPELKSVVLETEAFGVVYLTPEGAEKIEKATGQRPMTGDKVTGVIKATVEVLGGPRTVDVNTGMATFDSKNGAQPVINKVLGASPFAQGIDMIVPKDAIKFPGVDASNLTGRIWFAKRLSAKERSSTEKARETMARLDSMTFFGYGNLKRIWARRIKMLKRMLEIKDIVTGNASKEATAELLSFKDDKGEKKYQREGHFLLRGGLVSYPRIRRAVFKAAGTAALDAMSMPLGGAYGVLVPMRDKEPQSGDKALVNWIKGHNSLAIMPPNVMPMWGPVTQGHNVIEAGMDFLIRLGRDCDGDLGMMGDKSKLSLLGLSENHFPDWYRDRAWFEENLALPAKDSVVDGRTRQQVMVDAVEAYDNIGRACNCALVTVDTLRVLHTRRLEQLRSEGWSETSLKKEAEEMNRYQQALYLRMMAVEVQPYVDALKYDPANPGIIVLDAMVQKYLGNDDGLVELAKAVRDCYNAVKNMRWDILAGLNTSELEGSCYAFFASQFTGWVPVPEVDPVKVAETLLSRYKAEALKWEGVRRRSFSDTGGVRSTDKEDQARERVAYYLAEQGKKDPLAAVVGAWARKEVMIAPMLEEAFGVKLIPDVRMSELQVLNHYAQVGNAQPDAAAANVAGENSPAIA